MAISLMGTAGTFYANAASFFVVVLALLLMRTSSKVNRSRRDFLTETKAGFSYIVSQPMILSIMIMEAVSSVFGLDHAMLTIFARDILRAGADGFGLLLSARGLGAVLGSSIFIALGQRPRQGRILFVSALLYGAGFAVFGLSQSLLLSLALLVFVGGADAVWSAARATILQITTPESYRGRVMGVFQISNRGLHPLGQLETGLVVPLMGARAAIVCGGFLVSLITLLTASRVPGILRFRWQSCDGYKTEGQDSPHEPVDE
jgi:predicted MFS family arabinose efflux permease